jgi:hypothetical protein
MNRFGLKNSCGEYVYEFKNDAVLVFVNFGKSIWNKDSLSASTIVEYVKS